MAHCNSHLLEEKDFLRLMGILIFTAHAIFHFDAFPDLLAHAAAQARECARSGTDVLAGE